MLTIATLFSGGGGVECGAKRAGFTPIYAVEYDPKIAAVYRVNHGDHVQVCRVEDADPFHLWTIPTVLWVSPVCKNFSFAKVDGIEQDSDLTSAAAICHWLTILKPPFFVLENVMAYQKSKSFVMICNTLDKLGYWYVWEVVNAADFGVPQTRKRLILRASRDSFLLQFPEPTPWTGWYASIEDLIPTLPESQFAAWQLARLPEELTQSILVHPNNQRAMPIRSSDDPSFTTMANGSTWNPRAFILDGQSNKHGETITIRNSDSPIFTLSASLDKRPPRAFITSAGNTSNTRIIRDRDDPMWTLTASSAKYHRAWLDQGRVVAMTIQSLARLQSFPDDYIFSGHKATDTTIIGNSVPPLLAQAILESLL